MTSSKSIRAALFSAASFSLPSFRSNADDDIEKGSPKAPRTRAAPKRAIADKVPALPDTIPSTASLSSAIEESFLCSARDASLAPIFTPETVDRYPPAIQRKPVALKMSPPPQSPPPPPLSPPPYGASGDDNQDLNDIAANRLPLMALQTESPVADDTRPLPALPPSELAELNGLALAFPPQHTPEIIVPSTPSSDTNSTKELPQLPSLPQRKASASKDAGSPKQGKLQKENRGSRSRSNSLSRSRLAAEPQLQNPKTRQTPPAPEQRGRRSVSAQVPQAPAGSLTPQVRSVSSHGRSQSPARGKLRRSWLPGGGRSRSSSRDPKSAIKSEAWVLADETKAEYNSSLLRNGEKVPELWNENGNIYVYLYPKGSGCGPSFKVPDFVVGESYVFNELLHAQESGGRATNFDGRDNLSADDAGRVASPPSGPPYADEPNALRLTIPAALPSASVHLTTPGDGAQAELDRLIAIRNLFAFLTGQPLVATRTRPTIFCAFVDISKLLQEFGFSSPDGTSFGEAVELSFGFYSEQLGLSDCRHSREKTIEALVLAERMRCVDLYNEAFAHAAGKYSAIVGLRLPLFEQVSAVTRQKLERAHLDLLNRQHNVNEHLEQFEFPSMFSGIANSTSIPELRQVRFKIWRNSFSRLRQFLLSYYKTIFGSWPPKASSKKNPFSESGLNRLVLKVLYSDMCALYDLLVDRKNLTSRVMDEVPAISDAPSKMTMSALRNILSEFDRSKPPVLPPIPFDLPQLPSMTAIHETFDNMSLKEQNRMEKNIRENELMLILNKAYNYDTSCISLPFLDQFREFEIREGRGKPSQDLADQRIGYWIFLYAVLQSLPMLVVDAPGVKYAGGVEYFLCQPPMGNLPWMEDGQIRKMWYEVASGGGLVELSTDAVMFSVEGTYHRSHCWLAAKQWEGTDGAEAPPPTEEFPLSPLHPPAPMFTEDGGQTSLGGGGGGGGSGGSGNPTPPPLLGSPGTRASPPIGSAPRNLSPAAVPRARQVTRSSIAMGLEPLPLEPPPPMGAPFGGHSRSTSFGPRPAVGQLGGGLRTSSVGNLAGMAAAADGPYGVGSPVSPASRSGATFDDILAKTAEKTETGGKKKGKFF